MLARLEPLFLQTPHDPRNKSARGKADRKGEDLVSKTRDDGDTSPLELPVAGLGNPGRVHNAAPKKRTADSGPAFADERNPTTSVPEVTMDFGP